MLKLLQVLILSINESQLYVSYLILNLNQNITIRKNPISLYCLKILINWHK